MKNLLTAIHRHLRQYASQHRCEFGTVPGDAEMPYVMYTVSGGGEADYDSSDTYGQEVTVLFACVDTDYQAALDTVDDIRNAFEDNTPITMRDGEEVAACYVQSSGIELDPDPTSEGQEVWLGLITIMFRVNRSK